MENSTVKIFYKVYLITEKPGTHKEEVYKSRYKPACMTFISEQPDTNVYLIEFEITTTVEDGTWYGGKSASNNQ